MANKHFKHSAITWGGYIYQNYVGIQLLCDWLDDPTLYSWVKFEADDIDTAKGLDDVVALRTDGSFVLHQVKFTVDAMSPKNELSWEWLLEHKPKGKSLIQKWYAAWEGTAPAPIHLASLITNRVPSHAFNACLSEDGTKVEFKNLPDDVKKKLEEQISSLEKIEAFFKEFVFQHSYKGYAQLREKLIDRLVLPKHTTYLGWHSLFTATIEWAVRKNSPPPDGKITLSVLRGELDKRRPAPLDQTFVVPQGYELPNATFHQQFSGHILSNSGSASVLWGSPGQGKSTYLSYLCRELASKDVPYIRHHYFLNLKDSSERFALVSVANSLMTQMEIHHARFVLEQHEAPEKLREWIEACAQGYKDEGKPFVVVVDGLDHIWRENAKDLAPIDALFKHLLPVPDNVTLVLGTQRVSTEQLPIRLNTHVKASDWHELPRMSLSSVRTWLENRYEGEQFEVNAQDEDGERFQIAQLTTAFHEISQGHPLHLTYSFEAMRLSHRVFYPHDVVKLPPCPDGDIRTYYTALWLRLSYDARDALHLIADCGFPWPILSLEETLAIRPGILQSEIRHLLFDAEAGLIPFHGSLPAYIRDTDDHALRTNHLAPNVVGWLQDKAPDYYRWGWLWLYQAKTGNTSDLVSKPTREWAIDSMAKAYPENQMLRILSEAEVIAFAQKNYARAVRLRWLKTRLENGPDFQIHDAFRLDACSLDLTDDEYPFKNLSTSFRTANITDLLLLGRQYVRLNRLEEASDCAKAITVRINDAILSGTADRQHFESDIKAALELSAATLSYNPGKLKSFFVDDNALSRFVFFIDQLVQKRDIDKLLEWLPLSPGEDAKTYLELQIVRLAGIESIHLHERPEFALLGNHVLFECWARLYAPTKAVAVPFALDVSALDREREHDIASGHIEWFIHGLFFHVVAQVLKDKHTVTSFSPPETPNRPYLNEVILEITKCAKLAGGVLSRRTRPAYEFIFVALGKINEPRGNEQIMDSFSVRKALIFIAKDLFLLSALLEAPRLVSPTEWKRATHSQNFWFHGWLEDSLKGGLILLEPEMVRAELLHRLGEVKTSITQFNERAENYLLYCELACRTDSLDDLARELLRSSLSCILGYGWSKDSGIHHVLSALEAIAPFDTEFTKAMLEKICPMVANINAITDGDGTRHSIPDIAALFARLMPNTFTAMYDHKLASGEWYESERILAVAIPEIVESNIGRQVIGPTLWDSHSVDELRKLSEAGSTFANQIIAENAAYLALSSDEFGKDGYDSPSSTTSDAHSVDVTLYEPHQLDDMIKTIDSTTRYLVSERVVREWLAHWISEKRQAELLAALEKYVDADKVPYSLNCIFDVMFEISLKLQGKAKAYRWLVAAHNHRNGWKEYYHEAESLQRFEVFAKNFRSRWQDFIADTTERTILKNDEPLLIPHCRLVQFLVAVGQYGVAASITREMVDSTLEETSDAPLVLPDWFKGD